MLAKIPVSLGQYTLRQYESFNTRDGGGMNAILCKGTKHIAQLWDEGNGGEVDVDFLGTTPAEKQANALMVLTDMQKLIGLLNIKPEEIVVSVAQKYEGAAEIFMGVLEFLYAAKKDAKRGSCYLTSMPSWFSGIEYDIPIAKSMSGTVRGVENTKEGRLKVCRACVNNVKAGKLVLTFVRFYPEGSKLNWNLSFEDFASYVRIAQEMQPDIDLLQKQKGQIK